MTDSLVHLDVTAGIATITLDSPHNRNALSRALRAQLRTALADALADDAVRVVVLDHTGRVFCSGMDLAEAAGGGVQDQGVREFPDLLEAIWDAPKPVMAVVRGPARAGGIGLPEDSAGVGAHHGTGRDGVALQASNFLKDQRAQQDLKDQKGQTEPT